MAGVLPIAFLVIAAVGRPGVPARKLRPSVNTPKPLASSNFTVNVSPATITFTTSNNPGTTPSVAASQPASVTWSALSVFDNNNWTLTVQAGASSFANCPAVPVSAVTVTCSAATVSGIGATAACSGAFPLSMTPRQVAGGAVGLFSNNYSVTINFTLADSWKYIAEQNPQCSLSLTYVANVP